MRIIKSELCFFCNRFFLKFSRALSISSISSGDPSLGSNSQTCLPTWLFCVRNHGFPPSATLSFHIFYWFSATGRNNESKKLRNQTSHKIYNGKSSNFHSSSTMPESRKSNRAGENKRNSQYFFFLHSLFTSHYLKKKAWRKFNHATSTNKWKITMQIGNV